MLKFKTRDKIIIISGEYKGKIGYIKKILKNKNRACIVFNKKDLNQKNDYNKRIKDKYFKYRILRNRYLNKIKYNRKKKFKYLGPKLFSINMSKLAILDPKLKRRTRVKFKIINGVKVRICKKSNKILENKRSIKKKDNYVYTKIKKNI